MPNRFVQRFILVAGSATLLFPWWGSGDLSGRVQVPDREDQPVAIENVLIKTVTQGEFIGSVLMENGTITAVAPSVAVPDGARIIDGTGKILTPGLIDSHSHLGLGPSGGVTEDNEGSNPSTPELRIIDSIHPEGVAPHRFSFTDAVREGVTTVIARPGSGNVIGGMSAVLKLRGGTVDDMVLRFPVDMKMAMGKKGGYAAKGQFPMTKMGTAFVVRKAMIEANDYKEALSRFEDSTSASEDAVRPKRNLGHEAMMLVLDKEIPVHVHASPVDDIMTAVRLHDEFGFSRLSIGHGTESYKVADILAEKEVMVVVGPQMITFDDDGHLINIAGFLVDHGVEVNIMTDADVVQQEFLRFQAAIAVKYGMDPLEALKAITINPARWAGLDDRIGSIEEGKDADLVLFDGDPFDVFTTVQMVFIDGEAVVDASASPGEGGA